MTTLPGRAARRLRGSICAIRRFKRAAVRPGEANVLQQHVAARRRVGAEEAAGVVVNKGAGDVDEGNVGDVDRRRLVLALS